VEAKYEGDVERPSLKDALSYWILIMVTKRAITNCELAKWYTPLPIHYLGLAISDSGQKM
jgi:hypothetical protein